SSQTRSWIRYTDSAGGAARGRRLAAGRADRTRHRLAKTHSARSQLQPFHRANSSRWKCYFFFQAEDGIRDLTVTGVQTCALPISESAENLRLMRLLDAEYTAHPFYGSRRLTAWLERQGEVVNRKRVQRLLRVMGL